MSNLTAERAITLHVICSWCHCDMGTKETVQLHAPGRPEEHDGVTHSICDACMDKHYGAEKGAA